MPSIAVHLTIAHAAAQTLGICDMPQFYMGNIAPDAVNVGGFAPADVRYAAHIRSRSYSEWKNGIAAYRAAHSDEYALCPDFLSGVLFHLYTDIAWDETIQPQLFEHLRGRGFAEKELNARKWDELKGFDGVLSEKPAYKEAVAALKIAEPHAVTTVTAEQLSQWRDKIVSLEYPYPAPSFLTDKHIDTALMRAVAYLTGGY
jgi:hypothetical protein